MFEFLKKHVKKWRVEKENTEGSLIESNLQNIEEVVTLDPADYDMNDVSQREKFVESCLEQMAEASMEMESLNGEYQLVNAYLQDMEEVEAVKGEEREQLLEHANGILLLSMDEKQYQGKKSRMKDSDYRKMERMEEKVEEGLTKIKQAEAYQEAIRQDLQKLEGEKQACIYRKQEAGISLANLRGMAIISICAVFACIFLLLILQFGLKMDTKIGFVLTMAAAATALAIIYFRVSENQEEMQRASHSLNRVIILQNKVKIRYVNNTNLIEYLYTKYETKSGRELEKMFQAYELEREEREKIELIESDLEYHQDQLVKILKRHKLFDSIVWIHQPEAILDQKEMVEVRHNLIVRRQNLRKQMEYNKKLGENAGIEIKELVSKYPTYAEEILGKVSLYEDKLKK